MGAMKGLLRIAGTIDLSQFWPTGTSDTDTATVVANPDGFEFSPDASPQAFRRTRVFENATLGGKNVLKTGRKVTVRIQGIDAPELHCPPGVRKPKAFPKNKPLKGNGGEFRQLQGETSAAGLSGDVGAKKQANIVPCQITTRINLPNDAFDMFGRLIGDISFRVGGKIVSISHLAAQNGWALPAYYNSMNNDEILALQALFEDARKKKRGIWRRFDRQVGKLNRLPFRKKGAPFGKEEQKADQGPFVVPKIFRRQLRFSVLQQNNFGPGTFRDYLAGKPSKGQTKGTKDAWAARAALLANPTMKKPSKPPNNSLAGLLSAANAFPAGTGVSQPGDIVFFEQPSTLRKKNGTPINAWTFV